MRVGEEAGRQSSTSLIGFPILGAPCCHANSSRRWMRKKPKYLSLAFVALNGRALFSRWKKVARGAKDEKAM